MPLPSGMVQSYSYFIASREAGLIIITDDHEKVRDDRKEGFIFHLKQPLQLSRSSLSPHPKDENTAHLKDLDNYLIVYRKRSEIPQE